MEMLRSKELLAQLDVSRQRSEADESEEISDMQLWAMRKI